MHVSSHMRPLIPELQTPPRQVNANDASAATFSGLAPIAGFPENNRRSPFDQGFARGRRRPEGEDATPFEEEGARLADAAAALSVTLTSLELSNGRDGAPNPFPVRPAAPQALTSEPSIDDLLAQAIAKA